MAREDRLRERLAVADDLHDLLAHQLALISVQLGAALRTLDAPTPVAERSLLIATAACRESLDGLRRAARLAAVRYDPAPALADPQRLGALAASVGATLRLPSEPGLLDPVPPDVALCAFRLVELVLRDAGGEGAAITVARIGGELRLDVALADGQRLAAGTLARIRERMRIYAPELAVTLPERV